MMSFSKYEIPGILKPLSPGERGFWRTTPSPGFEKDIELLSGISLNLENQLSCVLEHKKVIPRTYSN
jgi:hypothetical protein